MNVEISPTAPLALASLFPSQLDLSQSSAGCGHSDGVDEKEQSFPAGLIPGHWQVVVDTKPTTPSSFTSFKSTRRSHYSEARARMGLTSFQDPAEVLLVNPKGEIMEGSLTNVYFSRHGRWLTPSLTSGGHSGTTRRWFLERNLCGEGVILAEDVVDGETCLMSNGVRGIISATVLRKERR